MARHRHTVNVRADGLQAVLGPLAGDRRILGAVLADVDSGMVLDAWSSTWSRSDIELVGAVHAEIVRVALGSSDQAAGALEVVLSRLDGRHDVLRTVADPHGDRLALSVVVVGPRRVLRRTRRRLRVVSESALTAGPSMARRPGAAGWVPGAAPAPPPPPPPRRRSPPPSPAPRDPAIMSLAVASESGPPSALRSVPDLLDVPAPAGPTGWADRPPAPLPALAPAPLRAVPDAGGGHDDAVRPIER